jgi:tetratricopeptide (TPR) repeat protein
VPPTDLAYRYAAATHAAGLCIVAALAAACRDPASCGAFEPGGDPDLTVEVCSAQYQRTWDPHAAVTVAGALAARKDDAALVAWAARVGDVPGTARLWRGAYRAHQRRGDRASMIAAAQRAIRLWQQQGAPGEAAYDAHALKDVYLEASQLMPALETARRERELALASDDQEMRRISFSDLADVLHEVGDYSGGRALLRDMEQQIASPAPEAARALRFAQGLSHFDDGHLELARIAYRAALAIDVPRRDSSDRAALYNLVEIEVILGELDAAGRDLTAALATLPDAPAPYMRSARAFFTALVARARHDAAGAEASVRAELARAPIADWAWQLEDLLGGALEDQGRLDEALRAYRRAIAAVEAMRTDLVTDALQTTLRNRKRAPYEAAFEIEARRGDRAAAMEIAELMWRRGVQDAFAADSDPGEAGDRDAGAPAIDPAAERVRSLATLVPQLGRPFQTATSPPVLARARSRDATDVLAYVEARGALWRDSRGDGPARLERLALPVGEARRLVADLRAHPDNATIADRLGGALIPAAALAASVDRPLAIISDGVLADLPFAALRVRDRWLVQLRTLQYWPALDVIGRAGVRAATGGDEAPAAVLAATGGRGSGDDLVAARAEAIEVGHRLGVAPIIGDQATIAALRRAAGARLLHLAAHGGLGPGGAFVRLADGEVTAADIVTWHLAPRTVVLASCASGARPSGSMWGALGGAFLAAGSRAVVATLWSVEDAATATWVSEFYAAGGDRDPTHALAVVQRRAIASGAPPRQWTALVVLAAPR